MLDKEFYLLALVFVLIGLMPASVNAKESGTENNRLFAIEAVNQSEIAINQASINIKYVS